MRRHRLGTVEDQDVYVALSGMIVIVAIAAVLALASSGCEKAPPSLSPSGVAAWQATRVVKALDLLRDTAILLNDQQPPVLTTDVTRSVVRWHKATLTAIAGTPDGWTSVASTSLDRLEDSLSQDDRTKLKPYFALAQTLIAEIGRSR